MDTYDKLYKEANTIILQHNPCKVKVSAGKATCVATRFNPDYDMRGGTLCCGGCPNLRKTGCSVKALACKIWVCLFIKERGLLPREVLDKLEALAEEARCENLYVLRGSKRATVKWKQYVTKHKTEYLREK